MELLIAMAILGGLWIWHGGWMKRQGKVADAQIDNSDFGGCLITSLGTVVVSAALIAVAFMILIANQSGVLP